MPSLTIKPPRSLAEQYIATSPTPPSSSSFTFTPPATTTHSNPYQGASSPVAPEYSPITPKVQPALPATLPTQNGASHIYAPPPALPALPDTNISQPSVFAAPIALDVREPTPAPAISPTQYIPQPPSQPFSSDDSTDAIALRSAISALQFQKKKAQDDIKVLERTRKLALDDPLRFRDELAAGRLREQRPEFGDLRAILDASDSDEEEFPATMGAEDERISHSNGDSGIDMQDQPAEAPDSRSSRPQKTSPAAQPRPSPPAPFARIPGPQNVVRMPHINWDKYHIVGEPLDAMHEQQRRWPGNTAYGQDRGREFSVAAPYSPFYDTLDGMDAASRKDSVAVSSSSAMATTPTGTISEHPMETRRSSKN